MHMTSPLSSLFYSNTIFVGELKNVIVNNPIIEEVYMLYINTPCVYYDGKVCIMLRNVKFGKFNCIQLSLLLSG